MKKRVAVIENGSLPRRQLWQILENTSDMECVAVFGSGKEALTRVRAVNADVWLVDLQLPGIPSGIQCVTALKQIAPHMQFIVLTISEDTGSLWAALQAGACGYIIKSAPPEQLVEAIRLVLAGGSPMSSYMARKMVQYFHLFPPALQMPNSLTSREQEVLSLLASGYSYREIGVRLSIGVETVRTHVKGFCNKMQVRNRLEAVARYCMALPRFCGLPKGGRVQKQTLFQIERRHGLCVLD